MTPPLEVEAAEKAWRCKDRSDACVVLVPGECRICKCKPTDGDGVRKESTETR